MEENNSMLYYVFHAVPFTSNYGSRRYQPNNPRIFPYQIKGGKEWEDKEIDETVQRLKDKNFQTTKIEMAKKKGATSLEVIKVIREIQIR
jgi:hypothetical protein